jgi:hypothetical protein
MFLNSKFFGDWAEGRGQSRDLTLATPAIRNGMEISRVRIPLKRPLNSAPLTPVVLLSLINKHQTFLKVITETPAVIV